MNRFLSIFIIIGYIVTNVLSDTYAFSLTAKACCHSSFANTHSMLTPYILLDVDDSKKNFSDRENIDYLNSQSTRKTIHNFFDSSFFVIAMQAIRRYIKTFFIPGISFISLIFISFPVYILTVMGYSFLIIYFSILTESYGYIDAPCILERTKGIYIDDFSQFCNTTGIKELINFLSSQRNYMPLYQDINRPQTILILARILEGIWVEPFDSLGFMRYLFTDNLIRELAPILVKIVYDTTNFYSIEEKENALMMIKMLLRSKYRKIISRILKNAGINLMRSPQKIDMDDTVKIILQKYYDPLRKNKSNGFLVVVTGTLWGSGKTYMGKKLADRLAQVVGKNKVECMEIDDYVEIQSNVIADTAVNNHQGKLMELLIEGKIVVLSGTPDGVLDSARFIDLSVFIRTNFLTKIINLLDLRRRVHLFSPGLIMFLWCDVFASHIHQRTLIQWLNPDIIIKNTLGVRAVEFTKKIIFPASAFRMVSQQV